MKHILGMIAMIACGTSAAQAAGVSAAADIAAAPDKVWAAIGDFCGIVTWLPALAKCELSADKLTRTLTTKDGAVVVETQESWDDAAMSYSYRIQESPLPVANYIATIKVVPAGAGSRVEWSSTFDAKGATDAEAEKVISGIYQLGFDGLKSKF